MLVCLVIAGVDRDFTDKLAKCRRFYCWQRLHILHNILSQESLHFSGFKKHGRPRETISVALSCLHSRPPHSFCSSLLVLAWHRQVHGFLQVTHAISRCREFSQCHIVLITLLFSDELKILGVCPSWKSRICLCSHLNHRIPATGNRHTILSAIFFSGAECLAVLVNS